MQYLRDLCSNTKKQNKPRFWSVILLIKRNKRQRFSIFEIRISGCSGTEVQALVLDGGRGGGKLEELYLYLGKQRCSDSTGRSWKRPLR